MEPFLGKTGTSSDCQTLLRICLVPFFKKWLYCECDETDWQLAHSLRMQISVSKDVRAKAHFPVYKNVTCLYFLFESHFISSTKNHRALIESLGHRRTACLHLKCVMQYAFSRLKPHFCFGCAAGLLQPLYFYWLFGIKLSTNIIMTTMDSKYAEFLNSKTKGPWSTMFVNKLCSSLCTITEWSAFTHFQNALCITWNTSTLASNK